MGHRTGPVPLLAATVALTFRGAGREAPTMGLVFEGAIEILLMRGEVFCAEKCVFSEA